MFLDQVAALTRERVERAMREFPPYLLREACRKTEDPPSFAAALRGQRGDGVGVIAEIKRSSPSRGPIRPELVVEELVVAYERGGACALSVLTEPAFFSGSMEDLRQAARATRLPVMRKDFILHPYQLLEARAAGASAVLLLVALLGEEGLAFMLGEARRAGLEALVEVHDEEEVEIALRAGADVLGINNRDLRTLHVDLDTTRRLARMVPGEVVLVSESGYSKAEDLAGLKALGVDAVLVGGHLSGSDDPEAALRELVRHARPEQVAGACRARESGKG